MTAAFKTHVKCCSWQSQVSVLQHGFLQHRSQFSSLFYFVDSSQEVSDESGNSSFAQVIFQTLLPVMLPPVTNICTNSIRMYKKGLQSGSITQNGAMGFVFREMGIWFCLSSSF